MNKKYYSVFPGQIKIDNEVFFGIDYKITDFIIELMEQIKKQKEVINKAIKRINDYKIYCKENYGFTQYTDIEIEAIKPILIKMEDILKEVSE